MFDHWCKYFIATYQRMVLIVLILDVQLLQNSKGLVFPGIKNKVSALLVVVIQAEISCCRTSKFLP